MLLRAQQWPLVEGRRGCGREAPSPASLSISPECSRGAQTPGRWWIRSWMDSSAGPRAWGATLICPLLPFPSVLQSGLGAKITSWALLVLLTAYLEDTNPGTGRTS